MSLSVTKKKQPTKTEERYLRSEVVEDFLIRKPVFLARWGLFIVIIILGMVTGATWLIHYPEIVTGRATIIARNTPKEILTRKEGRLRRLFVNNGDTVKQNQLIGYVESTANPELVLALDQKLLSLIQKLQAGHSVNFVNYIVDGVDELGELQTGYQQFLSAFQQYGDYTNGGYYIKKQLVLDEDLVFLQKNRLSIEEQKKLLVKDLSLSEETYAVNEKLLKDKVISKQDDRQEQSKLLGKQVTIPQVNASLLANESQYREKQKEISELAHTISQQRLLFLTQAQTLQSQVKEWIKNFVIIAPFKGQVSFVMPLQQDSYLPANKLLGYVNPLNAQDFYATAFLPQSNFSKIQRGQRVQLRFDAYPYTEFGFVNGKLNFISEYATDSGFIADILLPQGLYTDQHRSIRYHNGLKAEARVITKDMRLLEKFYYNLKGSVTK